MAGFPTECIPCQGDCITTKITKYTEQSPEIRAMKRRLQRHLLRLAIRRGAACRLPSARLLAQSLWPRLVAHPSCHGGWASWPCSHSPSPANSQRQRQRQTVSRRRASKSVRTSARCESPPLGKEASRPRTSYVVCGTASAHLRAQTFWRCPFLLLSSPAQVLARRLCGPFPSRAKRPCSTSCWATSRLHFSTHARAHATDLPETSPTSTP